VQVLSVPDDEPADPAPPGRLDASESDQRDEMTDPSGDPATPPPGTRQATRVAKGTPGKPGRRRGEALTPDEKRTYERVIRKARRLNLPPRMPGNLAKVADAAGVDLDVANLALKWGRRHGRL
jgi:hypothetical protein